MRRRDSELRFSLFMFQDIITCVTGIMILITLILGLEFITRVNASPAEQTVQQDDETKESIAELKHEIEIAEAKIKSARIPVEDLPSLDADDLKRRADDMAAESDAIEAEIATEEARLNAKKGTLDSTKNASVEEIANIHQEIKRIEEQIAEAKKRLKDIEGGKRVYYKTGVHGKATWIIEVTSEGYRVAQIGVAARPRSMTVVDLFAWAKTLDRSNAFLLVIKPGSKSAMEKCRSLLTEQQNGGFDVGIHLVGLDQEVLDPEKGAGTP
jgi:hypothetical protein